MDRDDPNRQPGDPQFEDEHFGETPEEAGAAQDDQWQDDPVEPIDDFADPEQAFAEEQVETNEGTELPHYAEDDQGPIEDEYSEEQQPEEDYAEEGEPSNARANAEGYLPKGMTEGGSKPNLMKYLPYAGAGAVLLVLGFLGVQQMQNMMGGDAAPDQGMPAMAEQQPVPAGTELPQAQPQPGSDQVGATTRSPDYILEPQQPSQPPQPVAQQPVDQQIMQPPPVQQPVVQQPVQQPVAQQPVAQPPAQDPQLLNQIAAMTRQMDDMRANQTKLEEQLRIAQNTPPPQPAVSESAVKAMEDKIASLEQKLAEKEKPAPAKTVDAPRKKVSASVGKAYDETDVPPIASEEKPKRKKAAKKANPDSMASNLQREQNLRYGGGYAGTPLPGQMGRPDWQQNPNSPGMGATALPSNSGGSWILRSAQPGSAWLSQGMSSDLTRVVPGDKVPGLGTIVSVRMVGGRWLVEGTQGSVR